MRATLLSLLLAACAGRTPAPDGTTAPAADADLTLITQRLSAQHPSEDCDALVDGLVEPRVALRRAVDEVSKPPWVGLIAGKCVARLYAADEEATLTTWLTDPAYAGLARAVVRELAVVPDEPVVLRLGAAALTGPARDVALQALAADPRPAVAALAAP